MNQQTVIQRLRCCVDATSSNVFLRRDFAHLGSASQVGRALSALQREEFITRAGYGVYLRPDMAPLEVTLRAVRDRLGSQARRLITICGVTVALGDTHSRPNLQTLLDEKKLASAARVLESCTIDQIRRKSLGNIERWNGNGTWVSALDEWRWLMECGSDQEIIAVMTGTDERCNRLRQSPPYVGLVEPIDMKAIKRKRAGR